MQADWLPLTVNMQGDSELHNQLAGYRSLTMCMLKVSSTSGWWLLLTRKMHADSERHRWLAGCRSLTICRLTVRSTAAWLADAH